MVLRNHHDLFAHVVRISKGFALDTGQEIPPTIHLANDQVLWTLCSNFFSAPDSKALMTSLVKRLARKLGAWAYCCVFEAHIRMLGNGFSGQKRDTIIIYARGIDTPTLVKTIYRERDASTRKLQLVECDDVDEGLVSLGGVVSGYLGVCKG